MSTAMANVAPAGATSQRRRGRLPPTLIAGGTILFIIVAAVLAAPLLTSHSPTALSGAVLAKPGGAHLLGTDQLGRDVWSRMLYGGRTDLMVAFFAVLAPFTIGTVAGALAGYYGGWLDTLVMRIADVVVAFPFYVLVLLLVFVLGQGVSSIIIAITVVSWVSYARIVRGETLVAKSSEWVMAAKVGGLSDARIIVRHILPNVITQAVVFSMSDIVFDLLAIVTLGYLGLGIRPPAADWGEMMATGQQFLSTRWELTTLPGLAVVLTALGLSLLGDGWAELMQKD